LPDGEGWQAYCVAARRKIDIAEYHLECLRAQANERRLEATIPVQAHLEGILFAFVAAADQMAEAINLGMQLRRRRPNLDVVLEAMPSSPIREQLFGWRAKPIYSDIRDLRRRAIHHHYVKVPDGPSLEVQKPAKPYGGPRDVVSYGEAAIAHMRQLRVMLDSLEEALQRLAPT
jgi:hypothetical protein